MRRIFMAKNPQAWRNGLWLLALVLLAIGLAAGASLPIWAQNAAGQEAEGANAAASETGEAVEIDESAGPQVSEPQPLPVGEAGDLSRESLATDAKLGEVSYEIEPVPAPPPPEIPIPRAYPPAIYLVAPTSGPWSIIGSDSELGTRLGLASVGDGFEVRILDEDSPSFARDLYSGPAPVAIVGHLYERTLAAAWPWYQRAEVPVISPFLSQSALTDLGEGFVGLMPDAAAQGLKLALEVPRSGSRRPGQVIILQGPEPADEILAETFREALLNPQAPEPTKRNPKPSKPRALNSKIVFTIPVKNPGDLSVLSELKVSPKDWVLLAMPSRLVLRCVPIISQGNLKRAVFLAPTWLATREVGALFLAAGMPGLQALVPLDMGTGSKPNRSLDDLILRYTRAYRREPTWPALMAYDVARLAAMAASDEAGVAANLADIETERSGSSGMYTLAPGGWPTTLVKVEEGRLYLFP